MSNVSLELSNVYSTVVYVVRCVISILHSPSELSEFCNVYYTLDVSNVSLELSNVYCTSV